MVGCASHRPTTYGSTIAGYRYEASLHRRSDNVSITKGGLQILTVLQLYFLVKGVLEVTVNSLLGSQLSFNLKAP